MLTLNSVEVRYSEVILALKGISFEVPDGKIIALMGGNGAGKTTTLKAISGLLEIEDGDITDGHIDFDDQRLNKKPADGIVRLGIVQIPEGRRVLEHFSTEENLKVGGHTQPTTAVKAKLDNVYQHFPRLKERKRETAGYLSGGEQQMLVIGRALMAIPKLMLVDEASLGLAPLLVEEIFSILKDINQEEKMAILLVEQNVRAALEIADHGYVMENGKIVLEGPSDKLRDNEDVREFYMGLSKLGEKKRFRDVKHYKRRKRWLA
jgi:branched-chain amino acid transport system ATP-binding protein